MYRSPAVFAAGQMLLSEPVIRNAGMAILVSAAGGVESWPRQGVKDISNWEQSLFKTSFVP